MISKRNITLAGQKAVQVKKYYYKLYITFLSVKTPRAEILAEPFLCLKYKLGHLKFHSVYSF